MALLLQRLNAAFRDDPGIDEYALVPAACPELFGTEGTEDLGCIAAQQKLAISIEGALVLYLHAFQAMRRATANDEAVEALESSRAVLLCSADCVGAWKCREKFSAHLNPEAELLFSSLLLRTNRKSGESWSQRRRLLGHMLQTAQEEERQRLLSEELVLLEELAKRYDHHYYAWNHWAWLDRQSLEHAPKTGALLQMDFPKLAFATPSHYGLFHHRLVRLQRQMAGQASEASKSRMELEGLPAAAAFTEEWNLALKLLKTFPHLEAPWAFRAQLFALLMEALDHGAEAETQMQKVGTLWKAEVEHAKRHTEEEESRRWALQFQVHLLQELGFYLLEAIDNTQATSSTLRRDAQTSLDELKSVEAASPAVLKNIARDLEECNQGYSLLQKQRPTGLRPPILRDFGHYMWGRACLNRICGAVTLEDG